MEDQYSLWTEDNYDRLSLTGKYICKKLSEQLLNCARTSDFEHVIKLLKDNQDIIKEMYKYNLVVEEYLSPVYHFYSNNHVLSEMYKNEVHKIIENENFNFD